MDEFITNTSRLHSTLTLMHLFDTQYQRSFFVKRHLLSISKVMLTTSDVGRIVKHEVEQYCAQLLVHSVVHFSWQGQKWSLTFVSFVARKVMSFLCFCTIFPKLQVLNVHVTSILPAFPAFTSGQRRLPCLFSTDSADSKYSRTSYTHQNWYFAKSRSKIVEFRNNES